MFIIDPDFFIGSGFFENLSQCLTQAVILWEANLSHLLFGLSLNFLLQHLTSAEYHHLVIFEFDRSNLFTLVKLENYNSIRNHLFDFLVGILQNSKKVILFDGHIVYKLYGQVREVEGD